MALDPCAGDSSLEADIESAKLCHQPACRRVSSHCSHLLDALIVFKAWFIQRQNEIKPTPGQSDHGPSKNTSPNEVTLYGGLREEYREQRDHSADSEVPANILLQRNWAVSRMKRAEAQLNRLRSACLTMRVQIEAGLRYKSEVDLVKRELELVRDTVHHYKSLIDEGNRLRDDLRSELARARKEASIARAQLNAAHLRPFDVNEHPTTSTPRTRSSTKQTSCGRRSSAARLVVEDRLGNVQSDTYMHTQLDRYIRWCDSLNEEVNSLRESLRDSTEKEVSHAKQLEVVRKYIMDLVEYVCTMEARRNAQSMKLAELALNFRWLGELAQLMHITLPDNFATLIIEDSRACAENLKALQAEKSSAKDLLDTSKKPNVDIDSDLPVDETPFGFEIPVPEPLDQHSNENNEVHTSRSPLAPSVEYFFSDSESSVSDQEASKQSGPIAITSSTANPLPPPLDPSRQSGTDGVVGRRRPKRFRKSSDTITAQTTNQLEPESDSFKTPLSRPSKTRRLSFGEAQTPVESAINSPSLESDTANRESPTSAGSIFSSGSTKKAQSDGSSVRRMRTRSQSTSSGQSSPVRFPACESHNRVAAIDKTSMSSLSGNDKTCVESRSSSLTNAGDGYPSSPEKSHNQTNFSKLDDGPVALSEALLKLLKPRYSDKVIEWFDRLSKGEPHSCSNAVTTAELYSDSAVVEIPPSKPRSKNTPVTSDVTFMSTTTPIESSYSDFLLGSAVAPSAKLLSAVLSNPSDTAYGVCYLGFVNALGTSCTEEFRSRLETKFVSICHTVAQRKNEADSCSVLTRHLFDSFVNLISNHTLLFHVIRAVFHLCSLISSEPVQFTRMLFVRLVRYLFLNCCVSSQQGLKCLSVILDACIQGFDQMWHPEEPLRHVAASQLSFPAADLSSYSYWIATVQALVAWQEAYFFRNKPADTIEDQFYDALFARLHICGWLPGSRSKHPPNDGTGVRGRIPPQHNDRVRSLALHLVDACLCVTRQTNLGVQLFLDHARVHDQHVTEAACSLTVLLSAMVFIVGDAATLTDAQYAEEENSSSQGFTHQRRRRNRQVQRQQRYGLLGWLLTSRLLPWLSNCLKKLDLKNSVPEGRLLIVDRLTVLITDIVVLGGLLFHNLKGTSHAPDFAELRSVVFDSGRRLMRLISSSASIVTESVRLICLARLFAFDPTQALELIATTKDFTMNISSSSVELSILWPEVSVSDLFDQLLVLAQQTVPHLPTRIIQQYQEFYISRLTGNSNR